MKKASPLKIDPASVQVRLGMCAAALAGTAAAVPTAQATIVTFNTPIVIPNDFTGTYINLATGANSPGQPSGWDFNPYNNGTSLAFYWTGAGNDAMGVATATGSNIYADLPLGSVVGPTSPFTAATAGTAPNYLTTGVHILGFEFTNEGTGMLNFGYAFVQTTASAGFPATILSWSYENNGSSITVVPEPSTTALLGLSTLVAGAIGIRAWRRKRAA
jgi:hypothetical protein